MSAYEGPIELDAEALERANARYTSLSFQPSRPPGDRTFAFLEAHEPIALGRLQQHADGALELGGFWVAQAHRGAGLARRTLERVLAEVDPRAALWCIPFTHLVDFYASFGLAPAQRNDAPASVRRKLEECEGLAARGLLQPVALLGRPAISPPCLAGPLDRPPDRPGDSPG